MALLLITHDLGIVRHMAERVCVMNKGRIVEQGAAEDVFERPRDDYTKALLAAEPKGRPEPGPTGAPEIMAADALKIWFPVKRGLIRRTVDHVKAVDGVTLAVRQGHTLGVVGESGSGKSTLGAGAVAPGEAATATCVFHAPLRSRGSARRRSGRSGARCRSSSRTPMGSLSPRLSVRQHRRGRIARAPAGRLLRRSAGRWSARCSRRSGLGAGDAWTAIRTSSRAVSASASPSPGPWCLKPKFIVLDEPTSALDMSVQAQIVELLRDLQRRHNLAYLFISHDLKVIRALAHDVIVLRRGKVVEQGPSEALFANPREAYTRALMAAAFEMKADETGAVGT